MLSLGGPLVISFFLLIINGAHYHGTTHPDDLHKLDYTWRILMGIGVLIPLSVFYFRSVALGVTRLTRAGSK